MATKVVKVNNNSSAGILAAIVIIFAVVAGGFIMYQNGYFGGNDADININLPNGQTISGSVSE